VSLRLRLLLALVALVAVGLFVADGVMYVSLRSFLVTRVDQQLTGARIPVLHALASSGANFPGSVPEAPAAAPLLPPGTYGAVLNESGQTVSEVAFAYGGSTSPAPSLPAGLAAAVARGGADRVFSAPASGTSPLHYRVLATQLQGEPFALIVAIPLTEVSQTLNRLLRQELLVTGGVLLGLAALAWWIVRREMRPLEDMARTAGAIAAGDLTRRIERAEARTEVGRLGLALNAMLGQIEQAFARRKASEDALRRFLAQASHELRTPLTSIRGYAELFRRGAKDRPEDLETAMRRIEQEAARMGMLVEELLLLARLDEGLPLEKAPVDLAQVAADAVADALIADPGRAIAVEAPEPVIVSGDESRLRQIAANLVTNALQHAGPQAHVLVRARTQDEWAVLQVEDDGVGLPPEVASRVFEPFFRASADKEESGAGAVATTGLGLAIAAGIAEAHGGSIRLETALGRGASFIVQLPL
jgi:two-component system, OmpR family, sensor kinase